MVILIGYRVAGFFGGIASLIGLMFPSVTLTIVMTALYASLRDQPVVQAALHGVVPATVGLGLVLSVKMIAPIMSGGRRQGGWIVPVYIVIIVGSIAAIYFWETPVVAILCGAGVIGGLSQWLYSSKSKAGHS
jgi:chromate transporter